MISESNLTDFDNIIIIDANFILLPFQFKIDYLDEINLELEGTKLFVVFKQVLDELEAKRMRQPNASKFPLQLKAGLNYLEQHKEKYNILMHQDRKNLRETTDDFLVKKAVEFKSICRNTYLATNDSELRKKAKIKKIYLIFLRQRRYLSFE